MILALIVLSIVILSVVAIKFLPSLNTKLVASIILIFAIIITITFCVIKPKMHKPFSLNIIEYLIKINNDGSMSTTKTTTTTKLIQGEK